jgi:hypothetical protein
VLLEVWERGSFSKLAHSTSRQLVNGVVLEVRKRGPCSKLYIGVVLEVLISSHLLKMIPWAGHANSHVAMRKRHGWPEGSDNEVLHVGLISSLGRPRQVICYNAKVSWLARRSRLRNPSLALLRKWSLCENDLVGSKDILGRAKTGCTVLKRG